MCDDVVMRGADGLDRKLTSPSSAECTFERLPGTVGISARLVNPGQPSREASRASRGASVATRERLSRMQSRLSDERAHPQERLAPPPHEKARRRVGIRATSCSTARPAPGSGAPSRCRNAPAQLRPPRERPGRRARDPLSGSPAAKWVAAAQISSKVDIAIASIEDLRRARWWRRRSSPPERAPRLSFSRRLL